ncbi:diguanylate cyclase domain-containing protein [Thalassotalea ganghwensis]
MLKTVKVPQDFQALFELAEAKVSEFFSEQKASPEKGSIEIHKSRYVLVRGAAFSVEFFQLVRKIFGDKHQNEADVFAASLLYELAHAVGQSDAQNFHETMNLTDPIAKLSAGPIHFAYSGWASVEIMPESTPSPDENFYLVYKHPYSFECDAWLDSDFSTDHPVCIMNAGYSSGWCQKSFGIPLEAREITCRSQGQEDCLFIMAQPQCLDDKICQFIELHPELEISAIDFTAKPQAGSIFNKDDSSFQIEIQQRLLTYARNLEATKKELSQKVELLNKEIEVSTKAKNALLESEQRWRELSNATFDAIIIIQNGLIVDVNRASEAMFSVEHKALLNYSLEELFNHENAQLITKAIENQESKLSNMHLLSNQSEKFVDLQFHDAHFNGLPSTIIAIKDITEQAIAIQRLERLANYDALTGLPNRTRFQRIVNRDLMNSTFNQQHAMLFLDLDNFKSINDSYGHSAGDHLLFEIAKRMTEVVRGDDVICRLGGDEFAIWLSHINNPKTPAIVAQQILSTLTSPIVITHEQIYATFSIGIATYPNDGTDYNDLTRNSDTAMYVAKRQGKNQYQYYTNTKES